MQGRRLGNPLGVRSYIRQCWRRKPFAGERRLEVLIERNMLQMSQVLGRERIPSRPQTRDLAKAVAHRTLQARHGSFFATLDETVGAL
jgi:hypothetical protein